MVGRGRPLLFEILSQPAPVWTSPALKGVQKKQNSRFPSKIALCLKKGCYKVYLCENRQGQRCKAFIGLSIHVKMIAGGRPILRENLADTDLLPCKTTIFNLFSLMAPQP